MFPAGSGIRVRPPGTLVDAVGPVLPCARLTTQPLFLLPACAHAAPETNGKPSLPGGKRETLTDSPPQANASSSRWARAYLSPARLAILDEATSHLDPVGAAQAETAFAARPGTLIVIAHRMSSALQAVLDGSSARIGDHATLLASSALYRDLVGHWQADHAVAQDS